MNMSTLLLIARIVAAPIVGGSVWYALSHLGHLLRLCERCVLN